MFIDFRERGSGEKREKHRWERETSVWERHIHQLPPVRSLTRDQTHNLAVCPDQELNLHPFGVQDDAPTNWAPQPGSCILKRNIWNRNKPNDLLKNYLLSTLILKIWFPNQQHIRTCQKWKFPGTTPGQLYLKLQRKRSPVVCVLTSFPDEPEASKCLSAKGSVRARRALPRTCAPSLLLEESLG